MIADRQMPRVARSVSARLKKEHSVLRKLRVVFGSAKKHSRAIEKSCGISGSQLWALKEISDHPGLKVSEMAERMAIHLSTASNLLDKLQEREMVRRERSDTDQRVVRLYLTAAGIRMIGKMPMASRGVVPEAVRTMPPRVLEALDLSLDHLISRLGFTDEEAMETPLADL